MSGLKFSKASYDVLSKELTLDWSTIEGGKTITGVDVSYQESGKSKPTTQSLAIGKKGTLKIKNPKISSVYYKPYVYDDKHIGAKGESGVYNEYRSGNLDGMNIDDCMSEIKITIETHCKDRTHSYDFTINLDQTTSRDYAIVNSLEELMPHLKKSTNDTYVRMAPGVYTVDAAYMKAEKYCIAEELGDNNWVIIQIMGNGNYYDFTGVRLNVLNEAVVLKREVVNLQTIGSGNVVRGLEIYDISGDSAPVKGYVNIKMDGTGNRIERVYVHSVGSFPYGYGELYGKGRDLVIKGTDKHSCLLVRGKDNYVKDCYLHHRAFGHYLFMQGATGETVMEGVYILGEINTTNNILAERGKATPADLVNFKSRWGYDTPAGFSLSLGEDAMRTYATGQTTTDNNTPFSKQNTSGTVIVKNCYVQHTRNATQLRLGSHKGYLYNTKSVGCQQGFVMQSGGVGKHLYADTQFGPALYMWWPRDRDEQVELTLIPYEGGRVAYSGGDIGGNASGQAVHVYGSNSNVTVHQHPDYVNDQNLVFEIGGYLRSICYLNYEDGDLKAEGNRITDNTDLPLVFGGNAKGNTITRTNTSKEVKDGGESNKY